MRFWFRGILVPLPGELVRREAELVQQTDELRTQLDAERTVRLEADAEIARLREELARAKGG